MPNVKPGFIRVTRWTGSQHPTATNITGALTREGLRAYRWQDTPNRRYAVRSQQGLTKVFYVAEGTVELTEPDANLLYTLRAGDRAEIPAGVRHGLTIGPRGAVCIEATTSAPRPTARTR